MIALYWIFGILQAVAVLWMLSKPRKVEGWPEGIGFLVSLAIQVLYALLLLHAAANL